MKKEISEGKIENSEFKDLFNETFGTSVENGFDKKYYENGQLKKQSFIVDGIKNGEEKTWYENGKLREECNYKNGMLNGEYTSFHENGKKQQVYIYKNGQPIKTEHWDENGKKINFE